MAPCCQCKGKGRCLSCFCVKRGLNCTSCHPNRKSRCANQSVLKQPLGLGKGSSQPQLPRNTVNIETTLSQPALPSAVSSAGLPSQTSPSTEESSCFCPPLSVVSATSGKTQNTVQYPEISSDKASSQPARDPNMEEDGNSGSGSLGSSGDRH